jgi:hypothetical protein
LFIILFTDEVSENVPEPPAPQPPRTARAEEAEEGSLAVEEGTEAPQALTGRSDLTGATDTPQPPAPASPEPWPKVTEEDVKAVSSVSQGRWVWLRDQGFLSGHFEGYY